MSAPRSLSKVRVPDNLTDTAYRAIKEYCLAAMAGDAIAPLTESTLAKQMGISKTPIREALKRLEGEGLVRIVPHKGAYIVGLTRSDMVEIFQVREYLEALAVRLVASQADDKTLDNLADMVKQIALIAERGDKKRYELLDIDLHSRIVQASGNQHLIRVYMGLRDYIRAIMIRTMTLPERPMRAQKWHEEIIKAVLRRDADAAESAIREHISQAREETLHCYPC